MLTAVCCIDAPRVARRAWTWAAVLSLLVPQPVATGQSSVRASERDGVPASALRAYPAERRELLGRDVRVVVCPAVLEAETVRAAQDAAFGHSVEILPDCAPATRASASSAPGETLVLTRALRTDDSVVVSGYSTQMPASDRLPSEILSRTETVVFRRQGAGAAWFAASITFSGAERAVRRRSSDSTGVQGTSP